MNCWHCKTELIWGGDHSLDEEDYPLKSGEYSMITNLSCPKCYDNLTDEQIKRFTMRHEQILNSKIEFKFREK